MIRLVTYADENMTISREMCIKSFRKVLGVPETKCDGGMIHEWDRKMLEATEFYQLNREILDQPRGSGYWAWKPYIIYKALLDMNESDILIYSDAGVEFINDVSHIINVMDEDLFLFGNNYSHLEWCKGDDLATILPITNHGEYGYQYVDYTVRQAQASVIFIRPTLKAKQFIKEWLLYCQIPNMIDDSPSKLDNYPTFQEHRHDQAILTCLQIKHGYKLNWWPASYNNGAFTYEKLPCYNHSNYPVIFHHHRKRNNEWQ